MRPRRATGYALAGYPLRESSAVAFGRLCPVLLNPGDGIGLAHPAVVKPGGDNVIAVLLENMGHTEESVQPNNAEKQPRGLAGASLAGSAAAVTWRIQGDRGGEDPVDPGTRAGQHRRSLR
jgi:hypothetical protein